MKPRYTSIAKIISLGFTVTILFVFSISLVAVLQSRKAAQITSNIFDHPFTVSKTILEIKSNILSMDRSMKEIPEAGNWEALEKLNYDLDIREKNVYAQFEIIAQKYLGDPADVNAAIRLLSEWRDIREEAVLARQSEDVSLATDIIKGTSTEHVNALLFRINHIIEFANDRAVFYRQQAESINKTTSHSLVLIAAVFMLISIFLAYLIQHTISVPIDNTIRRLRQLSREQFQYDLRLDSEKPLELLAQSVEEMEKIGSELSREISSRRLAQTQLEEYQSNLEKLVAERTQELNEARLLLSRAIDDAPIGMVMVKMDGYFERVNQAFCDMLDYRPEELYRLTFQDITHPDDRQIGAEIVQNLISGTESKGRIEKRYIRKNGRALHVRLDTALLRDETGKPQFFFTQIQDIGAQKANAAQMQRSHEQFEFLYRLSQMIRESDINIIDFSLDTCLRITDCDLGYILQLDEDQSPKTLYIRSTTCAENIKLPDPGSDKRLENTQFWKSIPLSARAFTLDDSTELSILLSEYCDKAIDLKQSLHLPEVENGRIFAIAGIGGHKDQFGDEDIQHFTLLMDGMWKLIHRKAADEKIKHYSENLENMVRDRTQELEEKTRSLQDSQKALTFLLEDVNEYRAELEKANLRYETANRELEAFAYSVSHDLRAPLRGIDGFSQVLVEDFSDQLNKEGIATLNRIRAASQRMSRLIDDLLALSRLSRQAQNRTWLDFGTMAQEIITEFKRLEPKRKVDISIQANVSLFADPSLFRVTLENLIGNAWKFTRNRTHASIEIGSLEKDAETVYFIRDNGAGFDMKYADKLFGPFQRLHTDREFEGTGIGLASVQRIINRHGGRVWAESRINKGTTIYFTLSK